MGQWICWEVDDDWLLLTGLLMPLLVGWVLHLRPGLTQAPMVGQPCFTGLSYFSWDHLVYVLFIALEEMQEKSPIAFSSL